MDTRPRIACQNVWPDYHPYPGDPIHPLACSCSGRGWYLSRTIRGRR